MCVCVYVCVCVCVCVEGGGGSCPCSYGGVLAHVLAHLAWDLVENFFGQHRIIGGKLLVLHRYACVVVVLCSEAQKGAGLLARIK